MLRSAKEDAEGVRNRLVALARSNASRGMLEFVDESGEISAVIEQTSGWSDDFENEVEDVWLIYHRLCESFFYR